MRIDVHYESWCATVRRRLDPLGLVAKAGTWYIVARTDCGDIRIHKVARVLELTLLDERFEAPPNFHLARHWQTHLAQVEASLSRGEATLRVAAAALTRIEQLGAAAANAVLAAPAGADGGRQAAVLIESIEHTAGVLLAFGADIEVLAPRELRAELRRRAEGVLALYSNLPADGSDADRS